MAGKSELFETNQAAIDLGNVAYLLVFSSMVFRIPLWLKPLYSSPVMACEAVLRRAPGRPHPLTTICPVAARPGSAQPGRSPKPGRGCYAMGP